MERAASTRTSAAAQVGLATSADAGALVRVIAGEVGGHQGPGSTYTPMTMVHATVEPGARLDLPWDATTTRSSTCSPARARSAPTGARCAPGSLAVLGAGDFVTVAADEPPGEPLARRST